MPSHENLQAPPQVGSGQIGSGRVEARRTGTALGLRIFGDEALLVAIGAVFVAASVLAARTGLRADSWLSFLAGHEIVTHGLPHTDGLAVLSHGRPWVDQQWLGQLTLYALDRGGGLKLVLFASVVIQLAALMLGLRFARRRGAPPLAIAPIALATWLVSNSWLRTQVFSQLLFVVLLSVLAGQSRKPSPRVFLALPLLALWANLHGAAVVGAALVALLGLSEVVELVRLRQRSAGKWARALALGVIPWLCLLVTPYGFSIFSYYRSTLANPAFRRFLSEWAPPTIFSAEGAVFFVLAAGAAVIVARRTRDLTHFEIAALVFTAAGALLAARSIPWFAYTALLLLPAVAAREWPERTAAGRESWLTHTLALVACVAAVVMLVTAARWPETRFTTAYPSEAVAAVAQATDRHPRARVLASYELADWLLVSDPSLRGRIAFDGRWELLSAGEMSAALDYLYQSGSEWDRLARGYSVFVLDPGREPGLVATYDEEAGMHVLYRSSQAVVYERVRACNRGVAAKSRTIRAPARPCAR
jgi:hypothetical protein